MAERTAEQIGRRRWGCAILTSRKKGYVWEAAYLLRMHSLQNNELEIPYVSAVLEPENF